MAQKFGTFADGSHAYSTSLSLPHLSQFLPRTLARPGLTVIVAALNAKSLASEHEAHLEHIKEENGGELPERIVYVSNLSSLPRRTTER